MSPLSWEPIVANGVSARFYQPEGPMGPVCLVWAHGGSWTRGSVEDWHDSCADLTRRSGCPVVSVGYRLSPRHPHPAALHDVLAAVEWAEERYKRVAVGGDSAGGTIAACVALTRRDLGRPLAGQLLAYPPLDPLCRGASYDRSGFPSRTDLASAWCDYRSGPPSDAYSTPWEVADLAGTAPAVLAVGALDPVADDVRGFARRLTGEGVPTTLRVFPGLGHGEFLRPGHNPMRAWLAQALRDLSTIGVPS